MLRKSAQVRRAAFMRRLRISNHEQASSSAAWAAIDLCRRAISDIIAIFGSSSYWLTASRLSWLWPPQQPQPSHIKVTHGHGHANEPDVTRTNGFRFRASCAITIMTSPQVQISIRIKA
ncbi:hypothetical protein BU23DRAFT_220994 [Bimuria novae-zelandiae CBS 107.79]|uniref:Uncharacterized protein n=1 Tax=Bimuria novae-zelandiae CBS 107.79 TaxID=1447943 RepID=A0A6A5UZ37_9PLEO|nr:hypothetical protein BU23DRAFT_220994 [Bimuria novae-zelandiae CBS 107.79]